MFPLPVRNRADDCLYIKISLTHIIYEYKSIVWHPDCPVDWLIWSCDQQPNSYVYWTLTDSQTTSQSTANSFDHLTQRTQSRANKSTDRPYQSTYCSTHKRNRQTNDFILAIYATCIAINMSTCVCHLRLSLRWPCWYSAFQSKVTVSVVNLLGLGQCNYHDESLPDVMAAHDYAPSQGTYM